MLGHRWHSVMAAWPNGLRHSPHQHHMHPKQCRLSANHYLGGQQCRTSRRYNCQRSPQGGEFLVTPLQIKPPPQVAQVHRTVEDLPLEGGEMVTSPSVTPEARRGRRVCSHHVRRAICPPGQCQVFHHQWHLKEPSLSMEVGQDPPSTILHNWQQDFAAVVGRRTWSMCSGSITNTMLPPLSRHTFFAYFLPHKEEALGIKERCPIDYMAYIEDHFYSATGLHLNGLRSFTAWIKQGSYYHGLVAQQGCLHECPHLVGLPLPRWPQVMPSASRWELQMKAEAMATSSSKPSAGAMVAPAMEAPVMEAPVSETPACSDTPAPMEMGAAGDGQSWAERIKAGADEGFQRARPVKCPRSQSRRHEPRPPLPFPLQDSEGRLASISQLYEHVAEQPVTHHNVAGRGIMHLHPEMLPQKARCLGNQVTCMIAEYHLTSSARGPSSLSPILPAEAAALLPPIKNYVPGVSFEGTRDVRVMDRARTL